MVDPSRPKYNDLEHDSRITRLEASFDALENDVRAVKQGQEHLAIEMRASFAELQRSTLDRTRGIWPLVISVSGVIIALGALVMSPVTKAIDQNKVTAANNTEEIVNMSTSRFTENDGDKLEERIENNEKNAANRDAAEAEVNATQTTKLESLDRRLEIIEERVYEHQKAGHPGECITRLQALENKNNL